MDLAPLRRRFVIAMGMPALRVTWAACESPGPQPHDDPAGGTGTLHIATDGDPQGQDAKQVAVRPPRPAPCETDEVYEVVCGSVAPPTVQAECGASGES